MNKKKSVLNEDHYMIRLRAEEKNAEVREALRDRYKRIRREKKNKIWRWWYRWMDRLNKRR